MTKPCDWRHEPMPDEKESFFSGRKLLFDEYSKLEKGIKPSDMDDKWFVYTINESIFFHRSWSGHCIFVVKVERENNEFFLGDVIANRKPDQFGNSEIEVKKEMFEKLVDLVIRRN
ncbi:hypothetical protein QSE00_21605 [Arenibacter sp. M-2]|uniref:hypothetical protein n=1 Tax=Arenibacter sp. M-2 TaxID=3053612 RepID=UPI0025710CD7|nr:hypothetical protein [Arenibacter sp. M-2]MDL5514424.1 hypothetical protein [Arenibacter sp. M-2]